jgi:DNA-binding GntR family transcriptional regulator
MGLATTAFTIGAAHPRLREVVAGELRNMILDGRLAPGERLVEDRLAKLLGVSRNPVREAIHVLEAEGFIDVPARRGAFVATLTEGLATDLFEVRLALEPLGARLAAEQGGAAAVARMKEVLAEAQSPSADRDLDHLADLHSELHATIFEMTGNAYLTGIAIPMVKRGQWLLRQNSPLQDPAAWAQHHALIAAIEAGDAELAETQARYHVLTMRRHLRLTGPVAAPTAR